MATTGSLVLEDGTTFKGLLFGANVSVSGEVGESFFKYELFYNAKCNTLASPFKIAPA